MNVYEAKTHLSRLLRAVEEGETVTICRDGKPVAVLGPAPQAKDRVLGRLEGVARIAESFDDPLPEPMQAAFEGRAD